MDLWRNPGCSPSPTPRSVVASRCLGEKVIVKGCEFTKLFRKLVQTGKQVAYPLREHCVGNHAATEVCGEPLINLH